MAAERASPPLALRRLDPSCEEGLAAFFAALEANGDRRHFHPHPFTAEEAHRICTYAGGDLYCAAQTGSEVVAYGMLRGWDAGFEIPSLGIAVHPRQRRTGIGRALMLFLHAEARSRGARQVRLKVYPDNADALRLYTALDYRIVGEEAGQLVACVDV